MGFAGVHHLALITNNMKAQIEFFTQVVGMKLVGLFPMHGVEGASHCFIEAGEDCFLSFIEMEGVKVEPVLGVSHARDNTGPVAGGAMQHLAFHVETIDDLMNLRDRLRSNGYAVFGPLDHMISHSFYLGAPEGILLEFATAETCEALQPGKWVEAATGAKLGMSPEDLERYSHPPAFAGSGGAVPQPDMETAVLPTPVPTEMFEALGYLSDEELAAAVSFPAPETDEAAE